MNRKTRTFVKKNGGIADLRNRMYIPRESRVFVPRKANGIGWSILTKLCLRYCSNALIDTKLINGGRLFIIVTEL